MGLGPAGISHHRGLRQGLVMMLKGDSAASLRHCHCLAGVWLLKVFCKEKCHKGWEE